MTFYKKQSFFITILVLGGLFFFTPAFGATKTWDGSSSNAWATDANWVEGTAPSAGDDLVFPASASNKSTSNDIAADTSFNSITFDGSGYTLATNRITLVAGITQSVTSTNTISLAIILGATQNVEMTSATGTLTLSGIISDGGNAYGLSKTGAGQLTLSGANTFTGGLTIKAGTVRGQTSTGAFGTGTITIGDDNGSADATLSSGQNLNFTNPITVASSSSGNVLSIYSLLVASGGYHTFSGEITLANNLTLKANQSTTLTLSGGIIGTGNIITDTVAASSGSILIQTGAVDFTGTITNSGSGAGTGVTISSIIGTNVTGVIQNGTAILTLSGANTFTCGLTIKAGTVSLTTSTSAGGSHATNGAGKGIITLGDSSANSSAVTLKGDGRIFANPIVLADRATATGILTLSRSNSPCTFSGDITGANDFYLSGFPNYGNMILSGSINNSGTITLSNANTSSYTTTISGVIGTNVTGVIQNSTNELALSGNNTFTSTGGNQGLVIKKGTVTLSHANGAGAGTITLGDTSGNNNATLRSSIASATIVNPINVIAGSGGTLTLGSQGYCTMTFSGAITLDNNLTIYQSTYGYAFTLTGGITGTGNVIINNQKTSATAITFSTADLDFAGTITNSGTTAGPVVISAVIGTNVTGVIQNSATSQLTLSGANTFTCGLTIKAGTVSLTTSTSAGGGSGTGTITLGDTSGSANATIQLSGTSLYFANDITVQAGSSGTLALRLVTGSARFTGDIALDNNLTLGYYAYVTGAITGTGNITISENGNDVIAGSVDMVGTITNAVTGTGTTTISGIIGTNVTGVIQNSTSSGMFILSGNNTFTSTGGNQGLVIKKGIVRIAHASGGGAGTVTVGDTSGSSNATLNGYLSGTIASPILIASGNSGVASVNATGSVTNTFSGAITLDSHDLTLGAVGGTLVASGGITGTGNVTINNADTRNATISTGDVDFTGTITHSGAGTSVATISAVIGTSVTGVIQNSATSALTLSSASNTYIGPLTITSGTCNVTQNNTFSTLTIAGDATAKITSGKTITLTSLVSTGTAGHLAILNSSTATSAHILTTASAQIATDYLSVTDSTPVQTNTWYAGANGSLVSNYGNWQLSSNAAPTVDTVNITNASYDTAAASISLTENTTKTVYIWGAATNNDTCEQIDATNQYALKFYRTNVTGGDACSADNNNCYSAAAATTVDQCSAGGADKIARYQFELPVYYYADPTDTGASYDATTWTAKVTVTDDNAATASNTSITDMASLIALNASASVNYGMVALGNISAEQTITITNTGNRAMDSTIAGDGAMSCSSIGSIAVSENQYSLSTGFTFGTGTSVTTSAVNVSNNTAKSTGSASTTPLYTLLEIPVSGVAGTCSNMLTFTAQAHNGGRFSEP